jgi:hypothetical protein
MYDFSTGRFTQRDIMSTQSILGSKSLGSLGTFAYSIFETEIKRLIEIMWENGIIISECYLFSRNDPVNKIDTTGAAWEWLLAVVVVVLIIVLATAPMRWKAPIKPITTTTTGSGSSGTGSSGTGSSGTGSSGTGSKNTDMNTNETCPSMCDCDKDGMWEFIAAKLVELARAKDSYEAVCYCEKTCNNLDGTVRLCQKGTVNSSDSGRTFNKTDQARADNWCKTRCDQAE